MGKEQSILTIDGEPTRPLELEEDVTLPIGDGRRGPAERIRAICRQYEIALQELKRTYGGKIVPAEVLKIGAERRRKIKQVLAEALPGQRDKLLEEGGFVSEITATVRGKKAA